MVFSLISEAQKFRRVKWEFSGAPEQFWPDTLPDIKDSWVTSG